MIFLLLRSFFALFLAARFRIDRYGGCVQVSIGYHLQESVSDRVIEHLFEPGTVFHTAQRGFVQSPRYLLAVSLVLASHVDQLRGHVIRVIVKVSSNQTFFLLTLANVCSKVHSFHQLPPSTLPVLLLVGLWFRWFVSFSLDRDVSSASQ